MATQTERLVVELEARVDRFNRDLTNAQRQQSQAIGQINGRLREYDSAAASSQSSAVGLARGMIGLAAAIGTAAEATQFLTSSVEASRNFESALSNLSAITGATGEDLEFLAAASRQFGATTTLSATQAADAFRLIASAQPQLLGNADALARVTREAITLSEAAGVDLADAANTLGNSLNQFNAEADQSTRFINVLAEGSRLGASSVEEISEALRNSGVAASEAGLSFEETNAVLQTLSTVGIRGSEAGTALRATLVALERSADTQLRPSVVGLSAALENLGQQNLDTTQLTRIFGQEHFIAANVLINNRQRVEELTGALTGTNAAYEQAATRVDNFQGDIQGLNSAYEGLQIAVGDIIVDTLNLRDGTQSLTEGIQNFIAVGGGIEDLRQLFQDISDTVVDGADFIGVYAEQWAMVFSGVGDGLGSLTNTFADEINLIGGFLNDLFDFYQRTFLAIPSTLQAVFESSLSGIRLIVTEAGLLVLGLVESLQNLPLVGDEIRSAIGETVESVRTLLEETAEADRAAIEGAFARAEATREAAFAEVEARREAREEEREQREEEDEAELERQQEIQERLSEIVNEGEESRQESKNRTTQNTLNRDGEEVKSGENKDRDVLKSTLNQLEQSTRAASSSSETVLKLNQAAGAASTLISTPAAIMKAYEQLGPIGGSIAAVGIAAAGLEALNTIRSVTLGGGGGGGGASVGSSIDTAGAVTANNEQLNTASIGVSDTTTGFGGTTTGGGTFRSSGSDALGEAVVDWLNDGLRSGQVEIES